MKLKIKAKRILRAVNTAYMVPSCMESSVTKAIETELRKIEREKRKVRVIRSERHRLVIAAINCVALGCWGWAFMERVFICHSCATHTFIIGLLLLVIGSVMKDGISYKEELIEQKRALRSANQ